MWDYSQNSLIVPKIHSKNINTGFLTTNALLVFSAPSERKQAAMICTTTPGVASVSSSFTSTLELQKKVFQFSLISTLPSQNHSYV